VIAAFEELGLLREVEKTRHTVPHGDRSGVVIEPYLTDQWYVERRDPGQARHQGGGEPATPSSSRRTGTKTYFEWMRNIQPWCVSRQLWWGHRIPAWYGPDRRERCA
jgi:valyl-tRNA synthetase